MQSLDGPEARGQVLLSVAFDSAVVVAAKEALAIVAQKAAEDAAQEAAEHAAAEAAEALDLADDTHAEEFSDKPPNELHITLISAKGLLVMDKVSKLCEVISVDIMFSA